MARKLMAKDGVGFGGALLARSKSRVFGLIAGAQSLCLRCAGDEVGKDEDRDGVWDAIALWGEP